MQIKINLRSLHWWYWFLTLIAMVIGLSGWREGFWAVVGISAIQFVHFWLDRGFSAFPTQVRFVYGLLVALALLDPTQLLYWTLLVGTFMVTFFDRCIIARVLILMPWNSDKKLS